MGIVGTVCFHETSLEGRMYGCMCTYVGTDGVYVYIYISAWICKVVGTYVCAYRRMYVQVSVGCECGWVGMYEYMYGCMFGWMYVCMHGEGGLLTNHTYTILGTIGH